MSSQGTEYSIQVRIPKGEREHRGRCPDKKRRRRKEIERSNYISADINSGKGEERRISFLNGDDGVRTERETVVLLRTADHKAARRKEKDYLTML